MGNKTWNGIEDKGEMPSLDIPSATVTDRRGYICTIFAGHRVNFMETEGDCWLVEVGDEGIHEINWV